MRWWVAALWISQVGWAHDLSADVGGTLTTTSADNPRAGAFSVGASGAWDFDDRWSLMGSALYTRDLATRSAGSSSPGSNVFAFTLGGVWLPTETLMTSLVVLGSPPVEQRNATTVTTARGVSSDAVVQSRTWNLGATWTGLWSSGGFSDFEHTVELSLGATRYAVFQKLEVPDTLKGRALVASCNAGARFALCPLVGGAATPLWQGRLGAGYTATLLGKVDVGLDATWFVYDVAPSTVGYFSLVAFGGVELGSGVPVQPLQVSVKPRVGLRLGPVTLKVSYQLGVYTEALGVLHAVSIKATWRVTERWRVTVTATGQADAVGTGLSNPGGQLVAGVMVVW